jgi:TolB protein
MCDENGANASPVSSSVENGASAGWLPDASAIAFYRYLKTGTEMWTVSVADRVEKRISSFGADGMIPRLSPDGREIVFHTMRANISNLWKFDLASGASTQLTSSERDSMGFGVWSPDSKWIAFERSHGSDADLLIMPRGGGQFVQLTEGPGLTWPGSWTGDNGHVLAAAQRNAVWNLIFVSVIDKSQQQLTHYQSPGSYVRSPVLNPRGDLIVFEFNQTKGNVYIAALGR